MTSRCRLVHIMPRLDSGLRMSPSTAHVTRVGDADTHSFQNMCTICLLSEVACHCHRGTIVCEMPGISVCLQVQAAGKAPSSMYGSEHLLRLLVKLPELLPMSSLPADNYGDCCRNPSIAGVPLHPEADGVAPANGALLSSARFPVETTGGAFRNCRHTGAATGQFCELPCGKEGHPVCEMSKRHLSAPHCTCWVMYMSGLCSAAYIAATGR